MQSESRARRVWGARAQTVVGALVGVAAGIASRWLLVDETAAALAVIVVAACAVLLVAPRASSLVVASATMVAAVAAHLPGFTIEGLGIGVIAGLLATLCLVGPLTIAALLRQQRAFQRRGWEVAALEARTRSRDVHAALQRERLALTADIHDGLGHRLTLIAVRLGQLSLSPTLEPGDRAAVAALRRASSEATEELGLAVRLLRDPAASTASAAPDLADAIAAARSAGISVTAEIPTDLADRVTPDVRAAVTRLIQEGLTNASKHAPSEPVDVAIRLTDTTMVAEIGNPRSPVASAPSRSSGYGLMGLHHRATVLGGTLEIGRTPSSFALTLTLPTDARPMALGASAATASILDAQDEAAGERAKATRLAIVLPAGILGAAIITAAGYLLLATTLSVMPPADFAAIEPGDARASVESSLPLLELLDAPRARFPAQRGEECRYYESEVSLFDRRDVHVICFDATTVTRTGTVPAP